MALMEQLFVILSMQLFIGALYYNAQYLFIPGLTDSYGGRWKFLTYLNTTSLSIYTTFSLFTIVTKHQRLRSIRDHYFASVVFPFASLVTLLFWGLFLVNEELVLPRRLQHVISRDGWYNHTVHSAPLLFALLDTVVTRHTYPSLLSGMLITFLCGVSYICWVLWVAFKANIWVYPILAKLNPPQLFLFFLGAALLTSLLYLCGYYLNRVCKRLLHHTEKDTEKLE